MGALPSALIQCLTGDWTPPSSVSQHSLAGRTGGPTAYKKKKKKITASYLSSPYFCVCLSLQAATEQFYFAYQYNFTFLSLKICFSLRWLVSGWRQAGWQATSISFSREQQAQMGLCKHGPSAAGKVYVDARHPAAGHEGWFEAAKGNWELE